jgi:hypothetical protein
MRAHEFIPNFRTLVLEDEREFLIKTSLITLLTSSQVSGVKSLTMQQIQKSLDEQGFHNVKIGWILYNIKSMVGDGYDKILKSADKNGVTFNAAHEDGDDDEEDESSLPSSGDEGEEKQTEDEAVVSSMAKSALKKRTP